MKERHKVNQLARKAAVKKLKVHTQFLRQINMYSNGDFKEDMPPNP